MNIRCSFVLAAAVVALVVSACSQPRDVPGATLASQFGTPGDDRADAVVNDPQRGYIYVGGVSATSDGFGRGNVYLRRYNQSGSLAWKRLFPVRSGYEPDDMRVAARVDGVRLDASGNVYLAWSQEVYDWYNREAYVRKFNPAGTLIYELYVGSHLHDFEVDGAGHLYVAGGSYGDHPEGANERFSLRKYNPQGGLLWERLRSYDDAGQLENAAAAIPAPYDIGLASDGSLYAAGLNENRCCSQEGAPEVSKYSNAGATLWEKPGYGRVTAAGLNFYLQSGSGLRKYDANGALRWERSVAGLSVTSSSVDADLHLFLAGSAASGGENTLFVRKYTPAGAVSWTYLSRRAAPDEMAIDVSARGRNNAYLASSTNGPVNGNNSGGYDALLLRLNAQGQKVWER